MRVRDPLVSVGRARLPDRWWLRLWRGWLVVECSRLQRLDWRELPVWRRWELDRWGPGWWGAWWWHVDTPAGQLSIRGGATGRLPMARARGRERARWSLRTTALPDGTIRIEHRLPSGGVEPDRVIVSQLDVARARLRRMTLDELFAELDALDDEAERIDDEREAIGRELDRRGWGP